MQAPTDPHRQARKTRTHQTDTQPPQPRIVDFQPGIRIDYRIPQVEIEAEVILRTGQLELFAYSKAPTPKEHETILLLKSRPKSIYQALGLIGLIPGQPMAYDWNTQETRQPTGDPVDVRVRYKDKGSVTEVSACDWMFDLARQQPMRPTHWLFTGSRPWEDGRFAADVEGTTVTVVNFDTALLTLPSLHSDSDADLWLAANTEAIPPIGARVTLILRPAQPANHPQPNSD
ncbi:MAG: YdjY domain-containing protein [Phycisphaerae bacterium]